MIRQTRMEVRKNLQARLAFSILAAAAAALILSAAPPAVWAAPAEQASSPLTLKEVAKRVDDHYNHLHSLSVQFIETYRGMGMTRTDRGTLLLAKSGNMKWSYSQPPGKVFVINGKYAYSYTPGDGQAQRYSAKQLQGFRSPLRYLLGKTRIQKELEHLTMTQDGSDYLLSGVPKNMGNQVSEVDVTVTPKGTIRSIEWKQPDGATTRFDLSAEQPDAPIPHDAFQFEPPAGVVVVPGLPPT